MKQSAQDAQHSGGHIINGDKYKVLLLRSHRSISLINNGS